MFSGSSTSATIASVNAPSNQLHHLSYDNAAYAGLDISTACHPPSLLEESMTSTQTSMAGRDLEAAPKLDWLIQSSTISILLASTPPMLPRWSLTDPSGRPLLADCLRSNPSKARKSSKSKQTMTTRTAMLWLQYLDMVSILQRFIKAERMANWKLHLQTEQDVLPYFAASGHSLYAKSAYVYLQIMLRLPETHPDTHRKFMEGYHVVRRSARFWAGLSPDLIIDQVLMRSIMTHDGLTRGKGMTENQPL